MEPHFSALNPDGLTSNGPARKQAEDFNGSFGKYQMPYYPTPMLHGLIMVVSAQSSVSVWSAIGQRVLIKKMVIPLPFWWRLPSEAVTAALILVLLLYGKDPCWSISRLTAPQLEIRDATPILTGAPVHIYGLSAGFLTGLFAYRVQSQGSDRTWAPSTAQVRRWYFGSSWFSPYPTV